MVTARQRQVPPNTLGGILIFAALAYQIAAFGVYWLVTGQWTIGQGGRLTDLGSLLFVGPLLVVTAGLIAGPRPGLRRFFEEPVTVALSPERLAVRGGGLAQLVITWDAVGGISVVGTGQAATHVLDVTARELVALPAWFDAVSTRRRTTLPELTMAMRPDRYRPLDERRPQRGCLLREVP